MYIRPHICEPLLPVCLRFWCISGPTYVNHYYQYVLEFLILAVICTFSLLMLPIDVKTCFSFGSGLSHPDTNLSVSDPSFLKTKTTSLLQKHFIRAAIAKTYSLIPGCSTLQRVLFFIRLLTSAHGEHSALQAYTCVLNIYA